MTMNCVHDCFEEQVAKHPQLTAVLFQDTPQPYNQLNERANQIAHYLQEQGVGPDTLVAVYLNRTPDMAAAVLGILKAGGAYVPLDPIYPQERLRTILDDCQAPFVLTTTAKQENLPQTSTQSVCVDGDWLNAFPTSTPPNTTQPDNLAYVIYTSGSTGRPKGVAMPHRPLVNLLTWQERTIPQEKGTRTLQFASLSFDVSFQEMFTTWNGGGTLVLVDEETRRDTAQLLQYLIDQQIERLYLPFIALQHLAEASHAYHLRPTSLRDVITAGEQLQISQYIAEFFTQLPQTTLHNHYGPSESHVVTAYTLTGTPDTWPSLPPIGQPISNVVIDLLDEHQQPVHAGETGELYIGGIGVARGYLSQPDLTAERFVTLQNGRFYKTGDLARRLSDGNIAFLGRIDHQVKISGYRVELGEIETALASHMAVRQAVVVAHETHPGHKRLVAYLVLEQNETLNIPALRLFLQAQLPDYMIPAVYMTVAQMPTTSSGKINRRALPEPARERPDLAHPYAAPVTATQQQLASVWAAFLQIDQVGLDDTFLELGGSSLLGVRMMGHLQQVMGQTATDARLTAVKLFQYPTVRQLAAYLDQQVSPTPAPITSKTTAAQSGAVAVIGMSGRFPGAAAIDQLWQNLCTGIDSNTHFNDDDLDPAIPDELKQNAHYIKVRGFLPDADKFDAAFFGIPPREAELMDPQHRVFLEAAWAALEDAGYVPAQFSGDIGLFAGLAQNTYYSHNVLTNPDRVAALGAFQVMLGNDKDYLATRTSYKLNLTGLSVNVNTACSTSLVAIAQAFHSLRNQECDMALAGGVAISSPQHTGYLAQEGGMLSLDGYCRPFDAQGSGTLFNDGVGVVVLKRLEDAQEAGDRIDAIIRGVGINNDGANKASFTAPSVAGQAMAVTMALAAANVSPETIRYVEAHGTATPLGDPIEVEALTQAYRLYTPRKQFCALGSIKGNVGHLTAASGVAGFIKAVLALKYRQIPPSLYFETPNPHIDFDNSPFYVNTSLQQWDADDTPRRAGVSSFGVGGTNAHIILEEAPAYQPIPDSRPFQLLLLSAKTTAALTALTAPMAAHLRAKRPFLPDVAYTLQQGRTHFPYRRYVVCYDVDDALAGLETQPPHQSASQHTQITERDLVFMFPGQGAQYAQMGQNLYAREPVFRDVVDECAALLHPLLQQDLRQLLYAEEAETETAAALLTNTIYTQPALFMVEYALAKLWQSWGIQPSAMIGHSIGEFVAACLAGVFSLADALQLVATRGKLMQALPPGMMLSVRAPLAVILPYLTDEMAIAAHNSPALCVVSGKTTAIQHLADTLTASGIVCKPLHTSHAFHSPMMRPVVAPFAETIRQVKLAQPQIPILSTVTATWLTSEQAVDPMYWANHLCMTVNFAGAIKAIWQKPTRVLLEVGPRATLATLARQQITNRQQQTVISTLGNTAVNEAEWSALLQAVGKLWLAGMQMDWQAFSAQEQRQRVSLPTYPFARERHWLEPNRPNARIQSDTATNTPVLERKESVMESPATLSRQTRLTSMLQTLLEDISGLDIATADAQTTFLEMGFDSLFLTQASLAIKRKFNVEISFRHLLETYTTLPMLAAFLDEQLPADAFPAPQPISPSVTQTEPVPSPLSAPLPSTLTTPLNDSASQSAVERLIAQQLTLMSQQLAVLQGQPTTAVGTAVSAPTNSPVLASTPQAQETAVTQPGTPMQPFGAIARIATKDSDTLTSAQQQFLDIFVNDYTNKTRLSKQFTQDNRAHMADPRVVTGFKPALKELIYPIVVERSQGTRLWDIDGNEYIDILNGFGSNFLGYKHSVILTAVMTQLQQGYEIGPQHPLTGEVAKLICEFTGMDRAAFCNTGSEAVLGAMRLARTITGRTTIAIFTGSYHGIFDEVLVRGTKTLRTVPAAPGVMPEVVQNVLVLDYGTDETLQILQERAHELAAVMVEPIQSRRPDFRPREFLHEVRRLTQAANTALIFDEVITGFRMEPGGAQAYYGIQADIATYGKVIGGGMPIGVIAGKSQYMDGLDGGHWRYGDKSVPEVGVTYFAGTFVRHPLALAAAKATLTYMKAEGPALQKRMNAQTTYLAETLNQYFASSNIPLKIKHFGSLFKTIYDETVPYGEVLFYLLRHKGIHIYDGFPCFLTASFTDADVEKIITAYKESISDLQQAGFFPGSTIPAATTVPTTESQREIWLAAQMSDDANCAYNESMTLHLEGPLDTKALEWAVNQLGQRHDALRTTFRDTGEMLHIAPEPTISITFVDLSHLVGTEQTRVIDVYRHQAVTTPFDLAQGPLLRLQVLHLAPTKHQILFTVHHIVGDGWSMAVMLNELGQLYKMSVTGIFTTLPPAGQFSQYAIASHQRQKHADMLRHEAYWQQQFHHDIPAMDMPTDHPRPPLRTYRAGYVDWPIDAALIQALRQIGARVGCTFFTTLLAAFELFLHRLLGQSDLVVGIPAAGQSIVGEDYLVGHCVNMLPLRSHIDSAQSFLDLLPQMRTSVLSAYEHQEYTFGSLLRKLPLHRDPSRIPLIPITFNIDQERRSLDFGPVQGFYTANPRCFDSFEMAFNAIDAQQGFVLECQYNQDLFDETTIRRRLAEFETLLHSVTTNPDGQMAYLPLLPRDEWDMVLWSQNRETAVSRPTHTIHELFTQQANKTPAKIAVQDASIHLTYSDLNQKANQLAHHLQMLGIGPRSLVGLHVERSVDVVVGILGILKAGAAYVPLDPANPAERLAHIINDAQMPVILTQSTIANKLPTQVHAHLVHLDTDWETISQMDKSSPDISTTPNSLAYVIYTSGSTGQPKGVMIQHQHVLRLFTATEAWYTFSEHDVWTLFHSYAFDFSVWELWGALLYGGRLVIVPYLVSRSPEAFYELLHQEQVTVLNQTPSAFRQLMQAESTTPNALTLALRLIIFGGETLELESLRPWFDRHSDTMPQLVNMYGITETTVHVTYRPITQADVQAATGSVIGIPIPDLQVYILDQQLQPVPIGIPGELYVSGMGVAEGYLNRADLTAARFLDLAQVSAHWPAAQLQTTGHQMPVKLYKTGDLGRFLPNQDIEYLGRIDNQVQIRGFRVELGEIESAMTQHKDIQEAVVRLREDTPGIQTLTAYIVPTHATDDLIPHLRDFLKSKLPAYMIPTHIMILDSIPLTNNGKIDQTALPEPTQAPTAIAKEAEGPKTDIEKQVASIYAQILHQEQVGRQQNFFEIGGHSLLAIQAIMRIREAFHIDLPLGSMFEFTTVAALSDRIEIALQAAAENGQSTTTDDREVMKL